MFKAPDMFLSIYAFASISMSFPLIVLVVFPNSNNDLNGVNLNEETIDGNDDG
jgi:hypothetical protein